MIDMNAVRLKNEIWEAIDLAPIEEQVRINNAYCYQTSCDDIIYCMEAFDHFLLDGRSALELTDTTENFDKNDPWFRLNHEGLWESLDDPRRIIYGSVIAQYCVESGEDLESTSIREILNGGKREEA